MNPGMADTARKAFITAVVFVAVVAGALALWKLKLVISILFLALITSRIAFGAISHVPPGFALTPFWLRLMIRVFGWRDRKRRLRN